MAELAQLTRSIRGAEPRRRAVPQQRYMAFLSYSHRDSAIADWLHEELEDFHVPKRLIGKLTEHGPIPKRLTPIFRDRKELAAASDLSEEIEEAIAGSRFMIVLCSPAAARSRWIDQEIATFKRMHRENRILAAIVDGEPFASDNPETADRECFPAALRFHFDRRGRPTGERAEPIAADLRDEADGRQMGLLKIAAGMMGVGLDDLAQREAQRWRRRLYAISAASIAGMLFTSGLAYTAIDARDEARDQRREAEGLIGFMLGDLREKLEPVGRLDVLDSVGARALAYYESQDKSDLSDESLAQRSRALTLMGEMANARGDLDGALRRYREAMASTAEAARRSPDNPQNLFDHAQNVFWVGYIDYQRGQMPKAERAFREYRRLADRMIALAHGKPEYRLERVYADTNLGMVLRDQRRYLAAAEILQQSLVPIEALVASAPRNSNYLNQLTESLAWLADAREKAGQLDDAVTLRQRQMALLAQLEKADKGDVRLKRAELAARRAMARLLASRGQIGEALQEANRTSGLLAVLTKTEPENTEWIQTGASTNLEKAELELAVGLVEDAKRSAGAGCGGAAELARRDPTVQKWRNGLQSRCWAIQARIDLREGQISPALTKARQVLTLSRAEQDPVERGLSLAAANMLLSEALSKAGQVEAAQGALHAALLAWPKGIEETPGEMARRATLLKRTGKDITDIRRRLVAMGYRHPEHQLD